MFTLSAIIWFGLYLHAALGNVAIHVNDQTLPVGDLSAGAFVSAKFDVGDATALTYGFDGDDFASVASAWRVRPGDVWETGIGFDVDGRLVTSDAGGDMREYAWMAAAVVPEPGVGGVLVCGFLWLLARRM